VKRFFGMVLVVLGGCAGEPTSTVNGTDTNVTDVAEKADVIGDVSGADTSANPCDGQAEGTVCDDGDPCTLEDSCSAGTCVGGTNETCETDEPCMAGTCVAGEGCKFEALADGVVCSMACFNAASCMEGACVVDADSQVECPAVGDESGCVEEVQCDPDTGECSLEIAKPEGTVCDTDADLCTTETCDGAGGCVKSGATNTCEEEKASDVCQNWHCDKKDGVCKGSGFVGEISCNDGNDCTFNDKCTQDEFNFATCAGTPIPFDDNNPCTDDSCVEGEILHKAINGLACDPEDPCSPEGTCSEAVCEPKTVCECTLDADCPQPENKCLGVAFCDSSGAKSVCAIKPETIVACEVIDSDCEVNACVPATGKCVAQPIDDGTVCNDGNPCTLADKCVNGFCSAGANLDCDDGVYCNGNETCDNEAGCQPGTSVETDDGVACTQDTCDEASQSVTHTPNDAACDNGLYCDGQETCHPNNGCKEGIAPLVDDGVPCTNDACDEAQDEVVHTPNHADCDDGLACNGQELCDVAKGCQAGDGVNIDDGIACTVDSCDADTGLAVHKADDSLCDNGLYCDGAESCDALKGCQAGTPPEDDDGVACTQGLCDEEFDAIKHVAQDAFCDNGKYCDGAETCDAAIGCQAGQAPNLDDGVVCTVDDCDEATDAITHTVDHAFCNNGQYCDGQESCDAAEDCVSGDAPVVDDGFDCTSDSCDEANDVVTHTPDDALCDDGLACNGEEICEKGKGCQAGDGVATDDGVDCTVDGCDPDTGLAVHEADDSLCDNGLYCDGAETCDAAQGCQVGAEPNDDDGVACTQEVCDEELDAIKHTPKDAFCDNEKYCDGAEICDAIEGCQAGAPPIIDDKVDCTSDSCDEVKDQVVNQPNDGACADLEVANCFMATCEPDVGCVEAPIPSCCGNAVKEVGEQCDDGNEELLDGCDLDCVDECKYFTDGTVKSHTKLSGAQIGYLQLELDNGDLFGHSLAAIGDVNGDGNDDIAIGAPHDDDGGFNVGAIYIGLLNENAEFISFTKISGDSMAEPPTEGAKFGYSLASLGDVDGDGVPDLAVGAPYDSEAGVEAGAVWVLFIDKDGGLAFSQRIAGQGPDDRFGAAVVGIGDLNEDGVQDFIASAPGVPDCGYRLRVINLKPNGTVSSNKVLAISTPADCVPGFGYALANVGEVAPDNFPDLLVGSEMANGQDEGQVVYYINITGPEEGDISTLLKGATTNDFGASLANLGDVTGDGIIDVLIGVPASDEGASNAGAVHIQPFVASEPGEYYSKIAASLANFQGKLDEGDRFGRAVIRLNSGGHPILAIGAPYDDDTGKDRGAVWITRLESSCSICGNGVKEPLEDCDEIGGSCNNHCACPKFASFAINDNWDHARSDCVWRGGDLARISSAEQNTSATEICKAANPPYGCWIGLKSPYKLWTDGVTVTYTNFDVDGSGSYLQLYTGVNGKPAGKWDDIPGGSNPYVCRFSADSVPNVMGAAGVQCVD
jgi:hypothetical protein